MNIIALHIDHENYEPELICGTLSELERTIDGLAKYFARIARELYMCDLSPSLIVHQGYMVTNRIAYVAKMTGC